MNISPCKIISILDLPVYHPVSCQWLDIKGQWNLFTLPLNIALPIQERDLHCNTSENLLAVELEVFGIFSSFQVSLTLWELSKMGDIGKQNIYQIMGQYLNLTFGYLKQCND